jgi:hypothetical protein
MTCYVSEIHRIAVDMKCRHTAGLLILSDLFLEELGEIGRRYANVSFVLCRSTGELPYHQTISTLLIV